MLTSNLQRALNFDFSRYQITKLFYIVLFLILYKLINASEENDTNHKTNSWFVLVCISVKKYENNPKKCEQQRYAPANVMVMMMMVVVVCCDTFLHTATQSHTNISLYGYL
jgi:hypothetical protein